MAKAIGAKEIVLAPIRAFVGLDHAEGMERLQKLQTILLEDFESFEIRITRKPWYSKVFPTYWIAQDEVFHDIMYGDEIPWFLTVQILQLIFISASSYMYYALKDKIPKKESQKTESNISP